MNKDFTFAMIKSHMADHPHVVGQIWGRAAGAGLQAQGVTVLQLPTAVAEELYAEHRGRPYFDGLIRSVTRAPVTAAILTGADAVKCWRALLGATRPEEAAVGTIRRDYGEAVPDNVAHGSDSEESAWREARIFYSETFLKAMGLVRDKS